MTLRFPSNSMRCQYSRLLAKLILAFALVACCSQALVAEVPPDHGSGRQSLERQGCPRQGRPIDWIRHAPVRRHRESAVGGGERSWRSLSAALPGEDRFLDAWPKAPFKGVDGWNLLEVTVRQGTSAVVFNGESREDLPPFVAGGKVALPGHVAAAYRNVVVIPIVPAK